MRSLEAVKSYIKKTYKMSVIDDKNPDTLIVKLPDHGKGRPFSPGQEIEWDNQVKELKRDLDRDSDVMSVKFVTMYPLAIRELEPSLAYYALTVTFYKTR